MPDVCFFHVLVFLCAFSMKTKGAALVRCAQPLVGLQRRRCFDDEQLLCAIRMTARAHPDGTEPLLAIMDARPRANVLANTAIGGGIEDKDSYADSTIELFDIPNIHVVRDAFQRALRPSSSSSATTVAALASASSDSASSWMDLIGGVLR